LTPEDGVIADLERFFEGYVAAFNRSLGASVDVDGIRRHFAEAFIGAGPTGVLPGRNDESFAETLRAGYAFYKQIGTERMEMRGVETTPIDADHAMARVSFAASYRKDGREIAIPFDVTYVLARLEGEWRIFAYVAGDEMAAYREHGLLPEA
jgi:hypothetical protein